MVDLFEGVEGRGYFLDGREMVDPGLGGVDIEAHDVVLVIVLYSLECGLKHKFMVVAWIFLSDCSFNEKFYMYVGVYYCINCIWMWFIGY